VEKDVPPWGGQAYDMGGLSGASSVGKPLLLVSRLTLASADEENFQVTLQAYKPPFIRCTRAPARSRPDSGSCQMIINTMSASTEQRRFGAVGVEGVQDQLPMVLTERKDQPWQHGFLHSLN